MSAYGVFRTVNIYLNVLVVALAIYQPMSHFRDAAERCQE